MIRPNVIWLSEFPIVSATCLKVIKKTHKSRTAVTYKEIESFSFSADSDGIIFKEYI